MRGQQMTLCAVEDFAGERLSPSEPTQTRTAFTSATSMLAVGLRHVHDHTGLAVAKAWSQ